MSAPTLHRYPTIADYRHQQTQHAQALAVIADLYRGPEAVERQRTADALTDAERATYRAGWNDLLATLHRAGTPLREKFGPDAPRPLTDADPIPWSRDDLHARALHEDRLRAEVDRAERSVAGLRSIGYARGAIKPEPGTFWEHQELRLRAAHRALARDQVDA